MNSLVGYGVSSDSDSDDGNNKKAECDGGTAIKKSRNFLLESGSASSSESDPEEVQPPPPPRRPAPVVPVAVPPPTSQSRPRPPLLPAPLSAAVVPHKLPPPHLAATSGGGSVFANPFKARADQKLSVLQKHVPLTLQARPSQIGGKRMCVSYRKDGRCRFGIKCKFAHDSDLQSSVLPGDHDTPTPGPPDSPGSDQVDHQHHHRQHNAGGIGGKRMCISYSKDGRCRFGIKCKFAHDSDLQSSVLPGDHDTPTPGPPDSPGSDQVDHQHHHRQHDAGGSYGGRRNFGGEEEEEGDGEEGQQGKKRRVGLSNTLVPPKRAMKQYARQRNREQVHLS